MNSSLMAFSKIVLFAALGLAVMFAVNPGDKNKLTLAKESVSYKAKSSFCKNLIAKDIISALSKTNSKQLIINLYPVKYSASKEKSDFDVLYSFQDYYGKKVPGGKLDVNKLKSGTTNYVQYLKSNSVPKDSIPFGYFVKLSSNHLKNAGAIELCFQVLEGKMKCATIAQKAMSTKSSKASPDEDSIGKCPPDCYAYQLLRIDSVGKCPPDCFIKPMEFQNTVQQIIKKVYGK